MDCAGPEGGATIAKSRVTRNSAGGEGGAINRGGCGGVSVRRTFLGENRAVGPGGAISGGAYLFESTIARNSSQSYGGGLALRAGAPPPQISVNRSTISGNSAGSGGGIGTFYEGPHYPPAPPVLGLQVQDSTIANNRADRDGGGIGAFGDATVNLDFVTVARNLANEGQHGGSQGPGQGGGLFQEVGGAISVRSTIVALNTRAGVNPLAQDCYTFAAVGFDSLGHNLLGTALDCPGFDAAGDLIGGPLRLGKLAGNGGPTKTIALKKGSRAIGNADPIAKPPGHGEPATTTSAASSATRSPTSAPTSGSRRSGDEDLEDASDQRPAGGLPGRRRVARDGLRRLGRHLLPDPHRRPGAQRLQAEGLLPARSRDRLQRQPRFGDRAAPRKALRAYAHGPGRGRRRHGGPRPDRQLAPDREDEEGPPRGQAGGHRRQRHRPHLRRALPPLRGWPLGLGRSNQGGRGAPIPS